MRMAPTHCLLARIGDGLEVVMQAGDVWGYVALWPLWVRRVPTHRDSPGGGLADADSRGDHEADAVAHAAALKPMMLREAYAPEACISVCISYLRNPWCMPRCSMRCIPSKSPIRALQAASWMPMHTIQVVSLWKRTNLPTRSATWAGSSTTRSDQALSVV